MTMTIIDQAQVGQKLAQDIVDENGRVLVPRGMELTDKHLQLLRRRGIRHIPIVQDEKLDKEAKAVANEIERLRHGFAQVIDKPLMKELYDILLLRCQRKTSS